MSDLAGQMQNQLRQGSTSREQRSGEAEHLHQEAPVHGLHIGTHSLDVDGHHSHIAAARTLAKTDLLLRCRLPRRCGGDQQGVGLQSASVG
jgi:hypothetical protein